MDLVVDIADLQVTNDANAHLVTYSLGSCIGVMVWDPAALVGGMIHYILPDSSIAPAKAKARPAMFANTGIPALFRAAYELGASKKRMVVKVAGGSNLLDSNGTFNIGKRNYAALRNIFWKNGVLIDGEHVGGTLSRTVRMNVGTGRTTLKIKGEEIDL